MERSEKEKVSNILRENREWFDATKKKPNPGERVVIRFTNEKYIYGESDTEIYYAEDIKVGRYLKAYEDSDTGRFVIDPPFPKYDYSPLSRKENLLEGTIVTHWAYPDDGELEGWDTRFNMFGKYNKLRIEVDPEHEEDVYRALMWGASFISRSDPEQFNKDKSGEGIRKLYEILCDLQSLIDKNGYIENGEFNRFNNTFDKKEYENVVKPDFMNPPEDDSNSEKFDWEYTLDEDAGTITLNQYIGYETNVTVYSKYEINGKSYNTTIECNELFDNIKNNNCSDIKTITFEKGIDTSKCTDMSHMFNECVLLTTINGLEHLDTSNVTDMSLMFADCALLASLDLKLFNTSKVTDMTQMFAGCSSLTHINGLENFDVSNVSDMGEMFRGCKALTHINGLENFNTSNVTDMQYMFSECNSLKSLDISNFNTSKVTNMKYMFKNCQSVTSLDLTNFDTSKVTSMYAMFSGCKALTHINGLENFDVSNVSDMGEMFYACPCFNDIKGTISTWNVDKEHLVADYDLAILFGCNDNDPALDKMLDTIEEAKNCLKDDEED